MAEELEIKIKYISKDIDKIEKIDIGDWIDLRAAEDVKIYRGQRAMIPLGIAMKLPEGYEAIIAPRSSLQKKGIVMGNSIGIIDNSYCGNDDQWHFPAMCTAEPKDGWLTDVTNYKGQIVPYTEIKKNERICQFRIQKIQPKIKFTEVEDLGAPSRGGLGSTGETDFKPSVPNIMHEDDNDNLINTPFSVEDLSEIKSQYASKIIFKPIVDQLKAECIVEPKVLPKSDAADLITITEDLVSLIQLFDYENINPNDKYEFKDGSVTTYFKLFTAIMSLSLEYYPEREKDFNKLRDLIIKGWLRPDNMESLSQYIHNAMKDISTMNNPE